MRSSFPIDRARPIRMLCVDLDGTLLNDRKQVSEENKRALQKAADRGIEVVIATGRQYRRAREFVAELPIPLTILANNGASVRDPRTHERFGFAPMPPALFHEVLTIAEANRIPPIVHVDLFDEGVDVVYTNLLPSHVLEPYGLTNNTYARLVERFDEEIVANAVSFVFLGTRTETDRWEDLLRSELQGPYALHAMRNLVMVESMLELHAENGTKWHSIERLANERGIPLEQVAAIGDDMNDLGMMQNAGLSIAPANAVKEVQRVSDIVLDRTNDEHAVAAAVECLLS